MAGRAVARGAAEIAEALAALRRNITRPEWSGSQWSGSGPMPGLEYTRPVPRPGPYQGTPYSAPEVHRGTFQRDFDPYAPREAGVPRLTGEVRPDNTPIVAWETQDLRPLSQNTLDFFDAQFSRDHFGSVLDLEDFFERVTDANQLFQATLLFRRVRPRLNAKEAKALQQSMEDAAVRIGVPPDLTVGSGKTATHVFDFVSPQGETLTPNFMRRFETDGEMMAAIRLLATGEKGGSPQQAKNPAKRLARLVQLDEYDAGPHGGLIGIARREGSIDANGEARVRAQLDYWRTILTDDSAFDYRSTRGLRGMRLSPEMPESEAYESLRRALRTADTEDEVAMILAQSKDYINTVNYLDDLESVADSRLSLLRGIRSTVEDVETVNMNAPSGLGRPLPRQVIDAMTDEQYDEYIRMMTSRGRFSWETPPDPLPPPDVLLARLNARLRRMGEPPVDPRLTRPVRLRAEGVEGPGVARDPEPAEGGEIIPFRIFGDFEPNTTQWISRGSRAELPFGGNVGEGDWVMPRGRAFNMSNVSDDIIDRQILEEILTGARGYLIDEKLLEAGTEAQRAFALRYAERLAMSLAEGSSAERRAAIEAIRKAKTDKTISEELLNELRKILVRRKPTKEAIRAAEARPLGPLESFNIVEGRPQIRNAQGIAELNPFEFAGIRIRPVRGQVAPAPRTPAPAPAVTTETGWSRYPQGRANFEASSAGDIRFSAGEAKLNGRTIEDIWQVDFKGGTKTGSGRFAYDTKGKPPKPGSPAVSMNQEQQFEAYKNIWRQWFDANPDKLDEVARLSAGKVITDKYASSPISQARAIHEILTERGLRNMTAPRPSLTTPPPAPSVTPGSGTIVPSKPEHVGSYVPRTIENAQEADLTIAIAKDFTTGGERLTQAAAEGRAEAVLVEFIDKNERVATRWQSNIVGQMGSKGRRTGLEQIRHGAEDVDANIASMVRKLNAVAEAEGRPVVINGAGNGLASLGSQAEADIYARHIIERLINHPERRFEISHVVTGGQNGYDIAIAKAAKVYGLKVKINPSYGGSGKIRVQNPADRQRSIEMTLQEYIKKYRLDTGEIGST